MSQLFSPLTLRGVTIPNRAWVSPMCQYSSAEGLPTDWHLVHLGALARGGAGLVMAEATAVTPEGRISPEDAGIWTDEQADSYRRITDFIRSQGAVPAIQLGHAGRRASTFAPFRGQGSVPLDAGGWATVGPSSLPDGKYAAPRPLTVAELETLVQDWAQAARRAIRAGFEVVEVHGAHGYLLQQFLSPVANTRTDAYGGDLAGRSRLLLEIVDAVRAAVPDSTPLLVRLSAMDGGDTALSVDELAEVAAELAGHGVDLIDASSAVRATERPVTLASGEQKLFAEVLRERSGLPVVAVGLITEPQQAEKLLAAESMDAVMLARVLLREPSWPQRAALELGDDLAWPPQYERGRLQNTN